MLNITWLTATERLVPCGVPSEKQSRAFAYRDRHAENVQHGISSSPAPFVHLTVQPLASRPRAKSGTP
jgi:hypothetical protein